MPYALKSVIKNKKHKNLFYNYGHNHTHKALIPLGSYSYQRGGSIQLFYSINIEQGDRSAASPCLVADIQVSPAQHILQYASPAGFTAVYWLKFCIHHHLSATFTRLRWCSWRFWRQFDGYSLDVKKGLRTLAEELFPSSLKKFLVCFNLIRRTFPVTNLVGEFLFCRRHFEDLMFKH